MAARRMQVRHALALSVCDATHPERSPIERLLRVVKARLSARACERGADDGHSATVQDAPALILVEFGAAQLLHATDVDIVEHAPHDRLRRQLELHLVFGLRVLRMRLRRDHL